MHHKWWQNFHFRVNYHFKTEMELGKMFKMLCILLRRSRLLPLWIGWLFEVCKAGLWMDMTLTGRRSLFFLKPHWCDWVSMATRGPWDQSLAWDKFRVERGATSHPKLCVCPWNESNSHPLVFPKLQIQQLRWGQESSGVAKRCHYGRR